MSEAAAPRPRVGVVEIFTTFLFIGATSFGGGVVAYLRENLVAGRHWLDDDAVRAGDGDQSDPARPERDQHERHHRRSPAPACPAPSPPWSA